jgi:heat shock protein HslJ
LFLVLCTLLVLWVGCGREDRSRREQDAEARPVSLSVVPTTEQLANTAYDGIYDHTVQLRDGRFEGEPPVPGAASRPVVVWIDELYATGDLNGDARGEAAVLLSENSGGSGTRLYLGIVSLHGDEPVNVGTVLVGDRTQVRSMRIVDGRVWMEIVEQGPDDAACCPTQLARKAWGFSGGALAEEAVEVTGTLSLALLSGTEWVLTGFGHDDPAPESPAVTIAFEPGRVAGTAGCNRYFASIEESAPGTVAIGPLGSTQMACPEEVMQLEQRFLACLDQVGGYSFLAGRLALSFQLEQQFGVLLFERR